MAQTIIANGKTYEVRENDQDIILDAIHGDEEMRVIVGGAELNNAEAYSEIATQAKGRPFSTEWVKNEAKRGLALFAKEHFNESVIVEP